MKFFGKVFFATFAVALFGPWSIALAQDKFLSRPIQIIVPAPAGGGTDITTRPVLRSNVTRRTVPFVSQSL